MKIDFTPIQLKPRESAKPIFVFADESSQTRRRFAAVGALYAQPLAINSLETSEKHLQAIKEEYGVNSHPLKWDKVPTKTSAKVFNAYLGFINYFFKEELDFLIVLQDNSIHPLRHHKINSGKIELGLSKLYYQLFRSLLRGDCAAEAVKRLNKFYLDVIIDDETIGTRVDLEVIRQAMARSAQRDFGLDDYAYELLRFTPTNLRASNLLQLADLLLGAGTAKWNKDFSSEGKKRIVTEIENRIGRQLTKQTWKTDKKYLVWHHIPRTKT